jgi:hypothetical protein
VNSVPQQLEIPPALMQAYTQRRLILFIGAGLSMGAGLDSWIALLRPLAQQTGRVLPENATDITSESLLRAATDYEHIASRHTLLRHLQERLDTTGISPTQVHTEIAKMSGQIPVIFTTNFDDLIERAFQQQGVRLNVVADQNQLLFASQDRTTLIKINGDLNRPETIVISRNDFAGFFERKARLAEELRSTLERNTVLFLGYSLQDFSFNQIWDGLLSRYNNLTPEGYAVMFAPHALDVRDLESRKIHVINLPVESGSDRTLMIRDFLRRLAASSGIDSDSPAVLSVPPADPSKVHSGAITTLAKYLASGIKLDGLHGVLKDYFSLTDDQAYEVLRSESSPENALRIAIAAKGESAHKSLEQLSHALADAYASARHEPTLATYLDDAALSSSSPASATDINQDVEVLEKVKNRNDEAATHPLHAFPRSPMVEAYLIPIDLVRAYARWANTPTKAREIVEEAIRIRREADEGDADVTVIDQADLPPVTQVAPYEYLQAAFTEARLHGPRMLAALILAVNETHLPQEAKAARQHLLAALKIYGRDE